MRSIPPTLRDLRREAGGPVPVMLAVTVLVQVLTALEKRPPEGQAVGELSLDDVILTGASLKALIDDPSRDPKARLAEVLTVPDPRSSERSARDHRDFRDHSVADRTASLFRQLVAGPDEEVPPVAARLLERFDSIGSNEAGPKESLSAARELGLQLFAAWARVRDAQSSSAGEERCPSVASEACEEVELRQRLVAALEAGNRQQVLQEGRELSQMLGESANADPDLTVARGWLEEQDEQQAQQQEEAKKTSLKLFLTGAPLVLATLLTGLLGVVMLFST